MKQVCNKMTRRLLVVFTLAISASSAVGQGYIEHLLVVEEPVGTRSNAMGGTGYSLADDETALFYNPAGLGIKNERWQSGALTTSYKNSSTMEEMWRIGFWGFTFQALNWTNLGFSLYFDHHREGPNVYYVWPNDDLEVIIYDESTLALGAGYSFHMGKNILNSLGIGLKWYHESLEIGDAPGFYANTIALDCGYLLQIIDQFRFGLSLKNIGPDFDDIIDDEQIDQWAIPFLTTASFGYKKTFATSKNLNIVDISSEFSYQTKYRKFSLKKKYNAHYFSKSSGFLTGIDLCILNTLSGRFGYRKDLDEHAGNSLSWGIGLRLFNHFDFDFFKQGKIGAGGFESPINEGFSTSYKRAFKWSRSDRKWWFDK